MSVEQRKVVDFIGTSKADGHIILTISDHLPFDGDEARLVALQDKLNDYWRLSRQARSAMLTQQPTDAPSRFQSALSTFPTREALHSSNLRSKRFGRRDSAFLTRPLNEHSTGIAEPVTGADLRSRALWFP
jgi:hypothetical protein